MAVDKLVDSTQLDANLTSVANAIRAKGGTSGQLAFPAGFVSAVQAIPTGTTPSGTKSITITENGTTTEDVAAYANAEITVNVQGGGGFSADDIASRTGIAGDVVLTSATSIGQYAFANTRITSLRSDTVTTISGNAFNNARQLVSVDLPNADGANATSVFSYTLALQTVHLPKLARMGGNFFDNMGISVIALPSLTAVGARNFYNCGALETLDFGENLAALSTNFYGLATNKTGVLDTLILRSSTMVTLAGTDWIARTLFDSGGSGGTIYIHKALYDHLGDGTALDYQAATNWSTIYGYGTITWAQIEGSPYENAYADGTPIT